MDPARLEQHHVLSTLTDRSAIRAYKILRTRIIQKLTGKELWSVGITGTTPGEGKTLTAINLAMALARDVNTNVFLVDLDLQRPQINSYLGLRSDKGLAEYLEGSAGLDEIIYDVGVERLAVIPTARAVENSSEALSSPRMLELVEALESELPRRIIVYDLPPLTLSDDVIGFAPRLDGIALVVAEGMTERAVLEGAKEALADMNLLGIVLNRSRERNDASYYY